MDVLCCINGGQASESRNIWKKIFGGPYYQMIRKKSCGFFVLGISVILFGLAIVGLFNIPVGLSEQVSMTVDSDLYNYFTYEKKYIEVGPPAYIVLNNFDYND
jgi:Niemann-Pick C1 protein